MLKPTTLPVTVRIQTQLLSSATRVYLNSYLSCALSKRRRRRRRRRRKRRRKRRRRRAAAGEKTPAPTAREEPEA